MQASSYVLIVYAPKGMSVNRYVARRLFPKGKNAFARFPDVIATAGDFLACGPFCSTKPGRTVLLR